MWTEYYRVVSLLMQDKQWQATLDVLKRARNIHGLEEGTARVRLTKGRCLEELGRKEEALVEYRKLLPGFLPDPIFERVQGRIRKLEGELKTRPPQTGSGKQDERSMK